MTYTKGDKVRCIKTIYARSLPSILEGSQGVIEAIRDNYNRFPFVVLWNSGAMSKIPYLCGAAEDEIELMDAPEKTYSEPLSGG